MATIVDSRSYHNHQIYTVNLYGNEINVTVTAVESIIRNWLYTTFRLCRHYLTLSRLVVGLGVQWTPGRSNPPADTLQLCIGRRCLIVQLAHANTMPRILREFLLNPCHTFVGFWNHSDRRKLESSFHCLEMYQDPLDLRLHVQNENDDDDDDDCGDYDDDYGDTDDYDDYYSDDDDDCGDYDDDYGDTDDYDDDYDDDYYSDDDYDDVENLARAKMEVIVKKCLGFEVEQRREIAMSDWDDIDLSEDQVVYATVDAYCAFLIGTNIRAWEI